MEIQSRIERYWDGEAQRYSESIQNELSGFKREAWLKIITEHAPQKEKLDILDIGTGPGFFAIILSGLGHSVWAVDCTENMLAFARQNAEAAGVSPRFFKMDSHKLAFDDGSFDLIVCRNLTWTLREPEQAYKEWNRVLRPGGRLLIFDANWHLRLFDQEMRRKYEEDMERSRELGLRNPHDQADMEESDRISRELPLSRERRPQWDLEALKGCGFSPVFSETDITERVWDESEKIMYRSTPMFMVGGVKTAVK
ncbi:MAG: class I SAM-dependent methyltransferase [Clostridiales bacterium]|jgi:ubiquinone/menaquinone biosynthesis C-methylase UbiE|nr:class I SAM-dependent methyltransferase [Eubacteriales bacterium]MDH7566181.1 class I SAM-dependent methyltransferase [Clostridiales bacterium]